MAQVPSHAGDVEDKGMTHNDVFGEVTEYGPNYRNVRTYITVGIVIYYHCGSYVPSPALGSADPTVKK